jgi:peptidoglycan/LPS O-acetylase OafA/YrhL
MSNSRTVAFWLFVYLAFSALISSALVFVGHAPSYPVFQTFQEAPVSWRFAFLIAGLLALLTAYLIRRKRWAALLTALAFLVLFVPSFRVVWGQISFGIWLAILATALTAFAVIRSRHEA